MTAPCSMFRQPRFADEVNDWLQNRATASDAQRFERYMNFIEQAVGSGVASSRLPGSPGNSSRARPATTLGFSPKRTPRQPSPDRATYERAASASPHSSTWLHTATKAAAGRLAGSPVAPPTGGIDSISERAYHPLIASAAPFAAAADLQLPADNNSSRLTAASGHSLNVTTAQAMHGLKDLYPDLWANTVPICRPDPAPNKNFISEWGESLKQGAAEAWAPYLASTYQIANLQVAKPTDEFAVRANEALVSWSNKQKLYFGDLLSPQAAAAAERLLDGKPLDATSSTGLSLADRKGLVEMLRQLNGVLHPDSKKSTMRSSYKPQYSVEDRETTSLMKEQTRVKTMGFPRKVEVKGFASPPKAATGSRRAGSASLVATGGSTGSLSGSPTRRGHHKSLKASEMVDTFSSNVPLKWASTAVGNPTSSYTASFGGNPGHAPQMHETVFKEVNVGYGHVDQHMYPSGSAVYPVEQLYVQQNVVPGQEEKEADMKTTQRMSYKPRDPRSVSRSIAAAQEQLEASQSARNKSTIPLSKAGIQLGNSAQWTSAYDAEFIERKADLSANKAMASAVAGMFNGPTIAYGKIAGIRREDEAKIAKHKAQQEAAAAARAQADAELDERAAAAGK